MSDNNQTFTINGTGNAVPVVTPGDEPVLVVNMNPSNEVYLGLDPSIGPTNINNTAPLPPNSACVFDGSAYIYATCLSGQTATVAVFVGALNYFQLLSVIVKTLIIAGTYGNGLYDYSGVPAAGSLIASITPAEQDDSYANLALPGITNYFNTGTGYIAVNLLDGGVAFYTASTEAGPWSVVSGINLNNGVLEFSASPVDFTYNGADAFTVAGPAAFAALSAASAAVGGSATITGDLDVAGWIEAESYLQLLAQSSVPGAIGSSGLVYGNASGTPSEVLPSGYQAELSSAQAADFTHYTVTADTFTQCSKAWSIPAGDAEVGTTYRLTLSGSGTQGSTQQELLFETSGGFATFGIPSTFEAASGTFGWKAVFEITVISTGASGTCNVSGWAAANNDPGVGFSQAVAFDTLTAFTFEIEGRWGSTTGAPTFTCYQSFLERLGT